MTDIDYPFIDINQNPTPYHRVIRVRASGP